MCASRTVSCRSIRSWEKERLSLFICRGMKAACGWPVADDAENTQDDSPTVLVAEDEAMLRLVAVETLCDAGFKVFDAGDGIAGLKILESDVHIDLLVSDVKMPGMSGYDLAEAGLALRP